MIVVFLTIVSLKVTVGVGSRETTLVFVTRFVKGCKVVFSSKVVVPSFRTVCETTDGVTVDFSTIVFRIETMTVGVGRIDLTTSVCVESLVTWMVDS